VFGIRSLSFVLGLSFAKHQEQAPRTKIKAQKSNHQIAKDRVVGPLKNRWLAPSG